MTVSTPLRFPGPAPVVIMVVGINGVGKTTSIGKLAHRYVRAGGKVMIAAADTFRAAANEQIGVWARAGRGLAHTAEHGADPAAVAFDAVHAAASRGADVIIIDTAGRLHTKVNLMEELRKIKRVITEAATRPPPTRSFLPSTPPPGRTGSSRRSSSAPPSASRGSYSRSSTGPQKGESCLRSPGRLNIPVQYIGVGEGIADLRTVQPHGIRGGTVRTMTPSAADKVAASCPTISPTRSPPGRSSSARLRSSKSSSKTPSMPGHRASLSP